MTLRLDGLDVNALIDDRWVPLPALWLRERATEPDQLDAVTQQRLFSPHLLPTDLAITSVDLADGTLTVTFSDGHRSEMAVESLLTDVAGFDAVPRPAAWTASSGVPHRHTWEDTASPDGLRRALGDLLVSGVIVVIEAPDIEGTVLDIARRFGNVRDTNFGLLFDVRSVPDSNDLAYRTIGLGAHTDNPYRQPVPGIQLLHCLRNSAVGGESTLVDALAVVDTLRAEDPEAVALLTETPVRFRFVDASTDLVAHRPIIDVDHLGRVRGLHYSPKLDGIPLMSVADTRRFHAARRRLAELLTDRRFEVRFALQRGEALVFSNDRVVHGRTAYELAHGDRHLQGCYIDHDEPASRYRVLVGTGAISVPV